MTKDKTYNFIDLFAGCGGLSEGFYRQGFNAVAHVELNHFACETLRERMKFYGYKEYDKEVIEADITSADILTKIDNAVARRQVDIIIGGPPCQAYSTAGRVRDKKGMENDPRNFLFESYVRILEYYMPKIFVFENVTGLLSAKVNGQAIFPQIINALGKHYNVISNPDKILFNSVFYGVPQTRKRIILIGIRKDITSCEIEEVYNSIQKTHYSPETPEEERGTLKHYVDVRAALGDLPFVLPGQDASTPAYEYPCNNDFLKAIGKKGIHPLMDHICRKHNDTDRERFRVMINNRWSFGEMRKKRPDLEHKQARVFDNSYVVQWWDLPCKTILAHIHKDGFQFIHPDPKQARSFTVREAARIQSFPDDFIFKGSRGEKYKQIGNAVPCLFAEAIAKGIKHILRRI
jgi:DNA (cytosine-5-)-methyltransferase